MAQAVPGVRPVIVTAGRVFVKSCVIGVPGVLLTLGVQRTSYAFAPSTATSATSSWPLFLPGVILRMYFESDCLGALTADCAWKPLFKNVGMSSLQASSA